MPLLLGMLIASNLFMTLAWFLHLRYPGLSVVQAIGLSWVIALLEYSIAIPAVRLASEKGLSASTIKVAQEAVTLATFALVIGLILSHTGLNWRFAAACALLVGAAALVAAPSS